MMFFKRKKKSLPIHMEDDKTFIQKWLAKLESTSKQLMWFVTFNAVIWIYLSYILAWTGHEQIAESLSSTVCTTVLGALCGYLFSSTIQNISKYNPKFGGTPMKTNNNYLDNNIPEPGNGPVVETEIPVDVNTCGPDPVVNEPADMEVVG